MPYAAPASEREKGPRRGLPRRSTRAASVASPRRRSSMTSRYAGRSGDETEIWSWRKAIPNGITLVGTAVGLTAMRLAQLGRFDLAVIAIVFAGLIDGLDGPAARILNAASQFGAELDSLSDYVCFGVTPSFVLYFWKLHELDWIGWFACLVFTLCMQCRLARFNAGVDFNTQHGAKNFFMGVPAPGGAGMAVMPIVGSLMLGPGWWSEARYVAVYHVLVGACLVSKIPTFSSKLLKRSMFQPWRVRALVAFLGTAFFVGLYALPWHTLTCCFVAYIASWPVSFFAFRRLNRQPVPVPPYIYHMPHGGTRGVSEKGRNHSPRRSPRARAKAT